MNKLKPEDVMRALECCHLSNTHQVEDCENCPFDECPKTVCQQILAYHALTILREKDAEIERLTAYNANLICTNTDITNRHKDYVEEAERIARADAITEFVERFKNALNDVSGWQMHRVEGEYFIIGKSLIDQIANELKGEANEQM